MSIMVEFYASCDACGIYRGEDEGEADAIYRTHAEAVENLRADGWHVTEQSPTQDADRVLCPGCRLEELHALAHSKVTPC